MKQILFYCFDKWLRPIAFFIIAAIVFVLSIFITNSSAIHRFFLCTLLVALFGLLLSAIYQLIKRRWIKGILTGLLLGGTVITAIVLFALITFLITTIDGDHWADNLTIPQNIKIEIPTSVDSGRVKLNDTFLFQKIASPDFQLYNSFQPGLYEYDFWTSKIEAGTIFLKAYEITQNDPLSTDRLPESTSIKVYNPIEQVVKYSTKNDFTIYEGDWDKPYAARFEVWFKPDNGGYERKLFEKNYQIEGWMR